MQRNELVMWFYCALTNQYWSEKASREKMGLPYMTLQGYLELYRDAAEIGLKGIK